MVKRKKPKLRKSGGEFICVLCRKGFTRRATVKDPHFASCVKRLGNPKNLAWDAHQSCWLKRSIQEPGPSGTVAPGSKNPPENVEEDDMTEEEEADEFENGVVDLMDEGDELPDVRNIIHPACKNADHS